MLSESTQNFNIHTEIYEAIQLDKGPQNLVNFDLSYTFAGRNQQPVATTGQCKQANISL